MEQMEQAGRSRKKVRIDSKVAKKFVSEIAARFDARNGGIGKAPKFPHASTITVLLQIHRLTGDKKALSMATSMLDHMALGGIYDQIEGGFYRYSTDAEWMIPHFEKMLYTNAELLEAYGIAYRLTGKALYRRVIEETSAIMAERYRDHDLYFSASDADSLDEASGHKEEGFYFVFGYKEAQKALQKAGIKETEKILDHLGISMEGNFENGRSNPHILSSVKVDPVQLEQAKKVLHDLRGLKPYPFIDHKLLSAWNGLMIHGLYQAAAAEPSLKTSARQTMDALIDRLYVGGVLYHQVLPGKTPKVKALMEDYSFVILALIDTFEATQDVKYLTLARTLTDDAIKRFAHAGHWMDSDGSFASAASIEGNAYRSALAVMAENLLRLEILTDDRHYGAEAEKILSSVSGSIQSYPSAAPYGVLAAIEAQEGYILLKGEPGVLPRLKKAFEEASTYPFVLYRSSDDATMLACRNDRCFAYDRDIHKLVKKVVESLK